MKAVHGQKSTLTLVLLLCVGFVFVSASYSGSSVSSVQVVNRTKLLTYGNTVGLHVKLTLAIVGHGLNENTKIKPTFTVGLRGSECYKNSADNRIDSDHFIFKEVIRFYKKTSETFPT